MSTLITQKNGRKNEGYSYILSVDGESLAEYNDPNEDEEFFENIVKEIREEHTHIYKVPFPTRSTKP